MGDLYKVKQRRSRPPESSGGIESVLDLALRDRSGTNQWQQPRGGVLRSGDLEIVVDRRLLISREQQTLVRVELGRTLGLVFRFEGGTAALFALSRRRAPQRVLGVAELSVAEWALLTELIAEVTYGGLILDAPPSGALSREDA